MTEAAREPLLCDLCRIFEADAMTIEGQALCARCANSMNPQPRLHQHTRPCALVVEGVPAGRSVALLVGARPLRPVRDQDAAAVTGGVWLGLLLTGIFLLGMTVR